MNEMNREIFVMLAGCFTIVAVAIPLCIVLCAGAIHLCTVWGWV